jgi:hypothetical protein
VYEGAAAVPFGASVGSAVMIDVLLIATLSMPVTVIEIALLAGLYTPVDVSVEKLNDGAVFVPAGACIAVLVTSDVVPIVTRLTPPVTKAIEFELGLYMPVVESVLNETEGAPTLPDGPRSGSVVVMPVLVMTARLMPLVASPS